MFTFQWIQYSNAFICFLVGKGAIIKYVRNWWGDGGSSIMLTAAYRGRVCHASCVRTHLHYLFSCFCQQFCLIMSCFICTNLILATFIQRRCIRQKRLFFSNEINFCRHEISSSYLKLFLQTKYF